MTTLHTVPDLEVLPAGTRIEDNEGDQGVAIGDGTFQVLGYGEPVYPSFFAFPVTELHNPRADVTIREQPIRTIAELDALPDGSVIEGLDLLRLTFIKQTGHWIDPLKPIGTTFNVRAFVHARRWGFRVAHRPA